MDDPAPDYSWPVSQLVEMAAGEHEHVSTWSADEGLSSTTATGLSRIRSAASLAAALTKPALSRTSNRLCVSIWMC